MVGSLVDEMQSDSNAQVFMQCDVASFAWVRCIVSEGRRLCQRVHHYPRGVSQHLALCPPQSRRPIYPHEISSVVKALKLGCFLCRSWRIAIVWGRTAQNLDTNAQSPWPW
jgi:hypothetical protein